MKPKYLLIVITLIVLAFILLSFRRQKITPQFIQQPKLSKFAVFSDIHSNYENLEKALAIAKSEQVEFIVITGDLTTVGNKSELLKVKNILDENGLFYYAVPGNHDLFLSRKIKANIWQEVFGTDYQSFKNNNEKFILINNGEDYTGISNEQWQWLINELNDCPQITCLIFMHEPINHPNSTHIMGETNPTIASQAAKLVTMLVDFQVKEVFAGHLHYSNIYTINGIKTTIIGAVSDDRNPQLPRILLVEGGIRKEVIIQN
jgi:predicted phosphodiesterase